MHLVQRRRVVGLRRERWEMREREMEGGAEEEKKEEEKKKEEEGGGEKEKEEEEEEEEEKEEEDREGEISTKEMAAAVR